ncbi:MAG: transketolase [Rhodospirillales bacterium]|nr:transketolase [Rhodospirillales bacterium]
MEASNPALDSLAEKAAEVRRQTFELALRSGKGHLGGSFSVTEVLIALYYGGALQFDPTNPGWDGRDRFIMSKAHSSNTLHYILSDLGFIPSTELDNLFNNGTFIGGHVDHRTPGIEISGGSLGHGLGVAAGMALGLRMNGGDQRVYVVIGDGESQEGSVWEAAIFASQHRLGNLIAITDHNGLGSEDYIENTGGLAPLDDKWRAFGWETVTVDGHDIAALLEALSRPVKQPSGKPTMIIAKTVKGKGMSTHENLPKSHHTLPTGSEIDQVRRDLA